MGRAAPPPRAAINAGASQRFVGTRFEETRLKNGFSEFVVYLDTTDGRAVEICVVTMPTCATRKVEHICVREGCERRAPPLSG